jgi:hypothetical protein
MKRPLEEVDGVGGESWDQVTKRLKKEFEDAKGKGKAKAKDTKRDVTVSADIDGHIKVLANSLWSFCITYRLPTLPAWQKRTPATATGATEYQSASLLYNALSDQAGSQTKSHLSFKASYTIVSTATPSVSLTRRVEIVSRELRNELKKLEAGFEWVVFLFFIEKNRLVSNPYLIVLSSPYMNSRLKPTAKMSTALTTTHTFSCTCQKTSSAPVAASDGLKRTQSDLSRYFGGISAKFSSSPASGKMGMQGCGGTIEVMVEDDFSHVMGIKGHKIVVSIEHPAA